MAALGFPFEVAPAGIEEILPAGMPVEEAVVALAEAKAAAIATRCPEVLVLAADTLVIVDGDALGKPANIEEARSMLRRLRGRDHTVVTGVCLWSSVSRQQRRVVSTTVTMRAYSDAEIETSIAAGTPFDKAGGYAIQDGALAPVSRIEGCYCNVMGLPLWTVRALLLDAGAAPAPLHPDTTRVECRSCPLRPRTSA